MKKFDQARVNGGSNYDSQPEREAIVGAACSNTTLMPASRLASGYRECISRNASGVTSTGGQRQHNLDRGNRHSRQASLVYETLGGIGRQSRGQSREPRCSAQRTAASLGACRARKGVGGWRGHSLKVRAGLWDTNHTCRLAPVGRSCKRPRKGAASPDLGG